jgi:hypothetical protein
MTADETHLSETEAADLLGLDSPLRLAQWREQGNAPPHHTDDSGGVVYRRRDVIDWREHYVVPPGELEPDKGER